jgi:hypothetical protein
MAQSMLPHEDLEVKTSFGTATMTLFGGVCTEMVNDVCTVWTVVCNSLSDAASEIADELSGISPFRIRE